MIFDMFCNIGIKKIGFTDSLVVIFSNVNTLYFDNLSNYKRLSDVLVIFVLVISTTYYVW